MRWLYDHTLDFRRFGSAELDICQVAAGRIEIFFECRLSPWDFAAGSLILQEAGGSLTRSGRQHHRPQRARQRLGHQRQVP